MRAYMRGHTSARDVVVVVWCDACAQCELRMWNGGIVATSAKEARGVALLPIPSGAVQLYVLASVPAETAVLWMGRPAASVERTT